MMQRFKLGERFQSYVRMAPTGEQNMYAGDVYVLKDGSVVGMMGEMRFRRVPRVLMNRFFSPAATTATDGGWGVATKVQKLSTPDPAPVSRSRPQPQPIVAAAGAVTKPDVSLPLPRLVQKTATPVEAPNKTTALVEPVVSVAAPEENSVITDCLRLISRESCLELRIFTDEASFAELGVDSVVSLVLSEKFKSEELQLDVKSSLFFFLECLNIGALKGWLNEYC